MIKAIIFDCDGVIADTEPLHLAMFQKVLAEEGISLTDEEYFEKYLALDDRGCFTRVFNDYGRAIEESFLAELIERKAAYIEPAMRSGLKLFPGVAEFVRSAAKVCRIAVASGALRQEIEIVLETGLLRELFDHIVSAEDVANSKPDPEPFLKALRLINAGEGAEVGAEECLVIEDSIHGVHAARAAGMSCLAVTNSYASDQLSEADLVVSSLAEVTVEQLRSRMR